MHCRQIIQAAALAALALLYTAGAGAQGSLQLTNEVFQEVTTTGADGKKTVKRVPATTVVPGTEVIYVVTYKNVGTQPAENVVVTNPVPKELALKSESTAVPGTTVEYSVDGGKTYGALATLRVVGADGKPRAALAGDVTHVRWKLARAVKPGEQGSVSLRAVLK
jgi:uncharacterized repeat protein (TIGR01451 family)